jgi:hypothetical protein
VDDLDNLLCLWKLEVERRNLEEKKKETNAFFVASEKMSGRRRMTLATVVMCFICSTFVTRVNADGTQGIYLNFSIFFFSGELHSRFPKKKKKKSLPRFWQRVPQTMW